MPRDVKYCRIDRMHETVLQIVEDIAFANEFEGSRTDYINRALGENIFLGADCREFRRYAVNKTVASFRSAVHDLEYILTDSSSALSIDDYNKALSRLNSYLGYFQHFNERKMLDRTLHDSSLNAVFVFSRNYTKANIRPDIKSLFNSSNYAQINLC